MTPSAVLLLAVLAACTTAVPPITPSPQPTVPDNTAPQQTPTPSATPTASTAITPDASPATRTVTSDDGVVTLEVPLSEPLADQVAVRAMTPAQAPPELIAAGIGQSCYELIPGDAVFSQPVMITSTWPAPSDPGALRFFFHVIRAPDGTWSWLDSSTITYTDDATTASGTTTHFSVLCRFTDRTELLVDPVAMPLGLVGDALARTISLDSADTRNNPIVVDSVAIMSLGPISITEPAIANDLLSFSQVWTCTGAGPYEGILELDLVNFARDNPFFTNTLGLVPPPTTRLNLHLLGECVTEVPAGTVDRVCIEVVHEELEDFVSYLEFLLWFLGPPTDDFDYIEVIIQGANDGQPQRLEIDAQGVWGGQLGLRGAGAKSLVSVIAHRRDGTTLDLTETVADIIGGGDFTVRFPEEDRFGDCD